MKVSNNWLRESTTESLIAELVAVQTEANDIRHIGHGHGNTPDFWSLAIKETQIRGELELRRIRGENTF